ncbi:DUF1348 family protein [Amylibacter marinus]|uniref:DUF1348 family protein n=1 Tax=Amylibacter marinus TaxID=1475483 RepID=UPI003D69187D
MALHIQRTDNDRRQWFRAYGNENWMLDDMGLMEERHATYARLLGRAQLIFQPQRAVAIEQRILNHDLCNQIISQCEIWALPPRSADDGLAGNTL